MSRQLGSSGLGAQILGQLADPADFLFMRRVAPGLLQTGLIPFTHGGQGEQPFVIALRCGRKIRAVGLEPECDRAEEGVDRREFSAGEIWSAKFRKAFAPERIDAFDIGRKSGIATFGFTLMPTDMG